MKIAIDAGHGPQTPGKRCPDDSMREFAFNSVVARYVRAGLLEYDGVQTMYTHADNGSRDVPLKERTNAANEWGADLFVSIHANAMGSGWSSARGIETFTYVTRPASAVALATAVQRQLVKATGLYDRGVKAENFHVLRESRAISILIECGFMSNHEEAALLKSDGYRRKCAAAIVAGVVEAVGLKKKKEESNDMRVDKAGTVVNGNRLGEDSVLIEGRVYVPLAAIGKAIGAAVNWNNVTKTVTITTKGAK
ncbi:N-acetylmuramoyl-L-alanine amidase [Paenibacillus tritici]|uniref:N-acetylmuramoyl-L-alanine amidase n=1 Tax=Paenibacillus tritici TaxID=1873425 RepID=A0ABX2DP00_9BACL|nr:N-acetylmuramoyl-L-alanine amidase [Paenibacillus tritici]NQX45359.1 N-acetylmuramoyl-L-alanine amidase [Paenibacillus tritici]